jgi:hypothetical protein
VGSEINGLVVDDRVPGPRQAAEKAVWSVAVREWVAKRRPEVDAAISRHPKDTDGLMPCSRVKVWSAIPTRCGDYAPTRRVSLLVLFLEEERLVSIVELLTPISQFSLVNMDARRISQLKVSLETQRLTLPA